MARNLPSIDQLPTEIVPSIHTVAPIQTRVSLTRQGFQCFCQVTDIRSVVKAMVHPTVKLYKILPHLS